MRGRVPGRMSGMRPSRFVLLIAAAIGWSIIFATPADADEFFSSSRGPLTSSHGALDVEAHCNDCHVDGSKALSNDKCLNCHDHDNLKQRIAAGKGFHASALVKGKKCETCHIEHKGKGWDLMGWKNIPGGEKT